MIVVKNFWASIFILAFSLIVVVFISLRPAPVVIQTNLENLPMTIAGYDATEDSFPDSVYEELNADLHVYRHYRNAKGEQIDLYLGYYGTAKGGRTGHNPYACLPSAGSAIVKAEKTRLFQSKEKRQVQVNLIQSRKNDTSTIMFYWYQTAGNAVVESGLKQNIMRFVGRVLQNRNDGAVVQVTTVVGEADAKQAKQRVELFAGEVLNLLPLFWPVEG